MAPPSPSCRMAGSGPGVQEPGGRSQVLADRHLRDATLPSHGDANFLYRVFTHLHPHFTGTR
jgi:hypothetical protein